MDSAEELQNLEITALRSIYAEDFIETPPPKAWKGAARLPEFIIRVPHPEPTHATKINFYLNVKFPKTYPSLACPTFTIQKPIEGLNNDQVTKLSHEIVSEAQKYRGSEMVFQIVTFCQDWLASHVKPLVEAVGSLALQMNQRAMDEEKARQRRAAEEAEREQERAAKLAMEREEQFKEEAMRQLLAREQQYKARKRANSEATEMPISGDTMTETFAQEVNINGVSFNTVKLFHPRPESLGTVYLADPICDDVNTTLPLELFVVTFQSHYYTTTQGRKKLKQVEAEIQRLTAVRHPNHTSVFAVKLTQPNSSGPSQLMVLSEQAPALTLQDVLEDCDSLREERASDYLGQILAGLNAIHAADLVHRGITARCIGLASRDHPTQSKLIKLGRVGFPTRLLDLHRSNPFGSNMPAGVEESQMSEEWLSRDVKNESSLLYTRQRDIHSVGIVLLQMLMGLDVTEKFSNVHTALQSSSVSPALARHATTMLVPSRKSHVSCLTLLGDLAETSLQLTASRSPTIPMSADPRTPRPVKEGGSPDLGYFRGPPRQWQTSRWKEDWEELELLGKGAFGSVVKARNKIDSRIYAVKKVRLKTAGSDVKIFREVNALSRLSHRFIVRYFTTWVETSDEPNSTAASDDSEAESGTEDGMTSVPDSSERYLPTNGGVNINFKEMDELDRKSSYSQSSFPSIHFGRSTSPGTETEGDSSSGSDDDFVNLFTPSSGKLDRSSEPPMTPPPMVSRTLYIQMEFVERQTLKERVDEGISEDEAWRLFQQIVDALVHMSTLSILHRDIKLTNIFIDVKGDCKVGDFGLATSSLAAVDPSDVSPHVVAMEADMTLEVGTRLYIAPEVQSRKRGPRNHSKADMYSLGIVFFEMNYSFSTGAERIAVIEDIRKPGIFFPPGWDPHRSRQREIITWLLQHNPDDRPSAVELSQSALLPARLEDEYFKGALNLMTKPDSPHHQAVLSSLFSQPPRPNRGFIYDLEADMPEHAALNDNVQERLASIFRLHGAVDMEPPLLMPVMEPDDESHQATFIDRHGDVVTLPDNILVPFARLAARGNHRRIKRYHIANIYRPNPVAGHPKVQKAAVFDIITPDLMSGPIAAGAELIALANDCLNSFPNLASNYNIHISHSSIVDLVLCRLPAGQRSAVTDIVSQTKTSLSQKRALLLKRGLLRSTADELETLGEIDEDIDALVSRLEKTSPALVTLLQPAVDELKRTVQFANATGVNRPILFHPLMLGSHHGHFKDGILIEVVRRNKRMDILAAGGRYDNLIARHSPKSQTDSICAMGIQIAVEKITVALASFQSSSVKALVKEERSFGFWSPRRCDVYVVSYHPGYLQDRLEVVSYLWQHNISADLMYESGLPDSDHESHLDLCAREGILFTVYPRPRTSRRDQHAFKVKSILKGTEYEISRQELVGWLQTQIAEQKRVDIATSGAPIISDTIQHPLPIKDTSSSSDMLQLLLPTDTKKQRKQVKSLFLDRAFETSVQFKSAVQTGLPTLAVDVPPVVFDAMIKSSAWITDEDAWRPIVATFPAQHTAYAQQLREAAIKRKTEGHSYILLFAVREERVQLVTLT
ncbi:kinase-like domain-containing protein [Collybia nuda]|uniref:non-specific serine/threonine protein kinase n=1 Tax=Collybia nuda TaxID=64659 RepID=A0A9P5XTE1_9AGAR|nr:kinase-like domain-containing protein [Collybia nuda]